MTYSASKPDCSNLLERCQRAGVAIVTASDGVDVRRRWAARRPTGAMTRQQFRVANERVLRVGKNPHRAAVYLRQSLDRSGERLGIVNVGLFDHRGLGLADFSARDFGRITTEVIPGARH